MTSDNGLSSAVADYAQQQQPKDGGIESAVADYAAGLKADTASQIRSSAQQAVGVNPDKQAEINDTAKLLGMPPSAAAANMEVVKQRAAAHAIPANEITQNTPHLAAHLADPEKMKLSSDDIATLDQVEKSLQAQPGTGGAILQGAEIGALNTAESANRQYAALGALFGVDPSKFMNNAAGVHTAAQPEGFWGGLAAMLPSMLGGPVGMAGIQFEEKQRQLEGEGVDHTTASTVAATQAETLGALSAPLGPGVKAMTGIMGKVVDALTAPLLGAMQYGAQQQEEKGILQSQGYNQQAEAAAPTGEGALQSALQFAILHLGTRGVQKITSKFAGQTAEAQKSLLEADQARSLSEAASASKLRARASDTFQQFVEAASKDGPTENVYVNPDTFKQSGITPEKLAEVSPSAREQLPAALADGSDIKIPTSEFATYIAGTPVGDALLDHIRFDPEAFTKAEAEEFFKTRDQELQKDIEAQLAKGENITAWEKSHEAVYQQVLAKLEASGKFPLKAEKEINAKREAADYMVLAARLGITPEEAYAKYGSTLNVPRIGSDTFNQLSAPPVDANGNITLHHWSRTPGLTKSDPNKWGEAGTALTSAERNRIGEAPGRTYFGIAPGEPGGYNKESHVGDHHYEVSVPANRLYDAANDPLGLRDGVRATLPEYMWHSGTAKSAYEKAIKDAGFAGYWGRDPTMGMAAAVFEPTVLRSTPEPAPETLINIGLKIGENEKLTPDEAQAAIEKLGVKFIAKALHTSATEPTLVAKLSRPLTPQEAFEVSSALRQEAIAQRVGTKGELYGPGADKWKPFNPEYFLGLGGNTFKQIDNPMLDVGFFSKMEEVLKKKLNAGGTAKQYLEQIRALAKKGEFKPDELKYSELERTLESHLDEKKRKEELITIRQEKLQALEEGLKAFKLAEEKGSEQATRIIPIREQAIADMKKQIEEIRNEPDESKFTKQDVLDMLQSARERYALHESVLESDDTVDPSSVPDIEFDYDDSSSTFEQDVWTNDKLSMHDNPALSELDDKGFTLRYGGADPEHFGNKEEMLARAKALFPEMFPKTLFDLPPATEGFEHNTQEVELYNKNYNIEGSPANFYALERTPDGEVDIYFKPYDGADVEHLVVPDMVAAKRWIDDWGEEERNFRQEQFAEYWQEEGAGGEYGSGETHFMQYKMPGTYEDYKELILHFPEISISGVSQHYRDFNTMAHIRFDTREGPNGEKVLFIEEVQADLHQQARNKRTKELEARMKTLGISQEEADASLPQDFGYTSAEGENRAFSAVTDVPFKKSYNELAMKRMLLWAVEHGHARIAWTTGKQQVDRWAGALRKAVDVIHWEKTPEGIHLIGYQKSRRSADTGTSDLIERVNTHQKETDLSDAIGKTMAQQIIGDPAEKGVIQGDNITISDTGMAGVYDRVLPNTMKKISGETPENMKIYFGEEGGNQTVHSIKITDELKSKIKAEGLPLYQGSRGEYDPNTRAINLLNAKNFSTYLHEDAGHHFLNIYTQVAATPDAPLEIKNDIDTVLKWFGVSGDTPQARLDAWHNMTVDEQRPMHEKWATASELYFMEGKSPSLELAKVFQKFRAWLLQIYKSTSDFLKLHPEAGQISPDIRAVMDRMHATSDQIMEAQDLRYLDPMFKSPKEAGMTDDEFKAYHLEDVQATQDAITQLGARSMRDLALTRNLHTRALRDVQARALRLRREIRNEVAYEVNNTPVNRARTFLKTGMVDGEKITEGAHRLNIDDLKQMYGDGPDAIWRTLESKYGANGILGKDGLHPDLAAEMFNFGSGDDLIIALLNSENPKTQIEAETDKRMLEQYGDITNPQAQQEAADRAIHNEARTRSVRTELWALERLANIPRTMKEAIKIHAENTVAKQAIRNIKPRSYMSAETRAAKASVKALKAGDVVEAAKQKRNQVIQHEATRAANKALDDVEAALKYFKKFDRKSTRRAVGLDAIAQIDALLNKFDLSKTTTLKELDIRQWISEQETRGLMPNVDPRLLQDSFIQSYKDMSLEAFHGLTDAVKSIEAIGRRETTIADNEKRRAFKEVIDEAKTALDVLPKRTESPNRNPGVGGKGLDRIEAKYLKLKSYLRSADASLLKMEQIGDWLDSADSNGVFNRMLYRPIAKAVAHHNDMAREVGDMFSALHDVVDAKFYKDLYNRHTIPELIDSRTGQPSKMLKSEILAMALNTRNDSNFNKMLEGEKWLKEDVLKVLDRHLSAADIRFINGYGKIAEYRYEDEKALYKRLGKETGPKVTGDDIPLANGTIEGGYYPIVYDPSRDPNVQDRAAKNADAMFEETTYRAPSTETGRMNARVEGYSAPILFSLDALPRVTMDKIRNLALREVIIDADKFIRNRDVRKGIGQALGPEYYAQFRPWLQSIANDRAFDPQAASWIDRLAHEGRISATMVGLGFRLSTILKHGSTATFHSVGELGPRWAVSGVKAFAGSPAKMMAAKDFVFERSDFMRQRMGNVERDFRDGLRDMDTRALTSAGNKLMPVYDNVRRFAMYGVAMSDMASCMPTWVGGYNRALHEGMSEEDAIYAADKAVRNAHGASGPQDLAQIMRGPELQKTLTMFYNFWNHFYNRQRDIGRGFTQARTTGDFAQLLAKSFFYIGATAAVHAYFTAPKHDDKDKLLKRMGIEVASTMFDGIPVARDIANHMAEHGLNNFKDINFEQSASAPIVGVGKSALDVKKALDGKPDPQWVKNALNTAGYIFGLPTGQVASTTQFLWDVGHGHAHPRTAADWFNGAVHGRM